ncbi:MAG TPA: DUF4386 family protein [Propionibacteriaceae bacterium]|jgi:uncharacterized protein DUF4386|nr:DUF4386 family protein [Propionibacteriaceae bacterium]
MAASAQEEPGRPVERLLVAAGALWIVGAVVSFVGGTLHPHRELPNDHPAVFAEYAASTNWLWVHYLQFAAALTVVAGFLVLYEAMSRRGVVSVLERSGYAAAIATALIFAANMAVDGIALKRAVDAWAAASDADKPIRFAAAETVRWLEWGANSFFQILLGLTLILFGLGIARTGICWRPAGWLGVLAGIGLVIGGLLTGRDGFAGSPVQSVAQLLFLVMALAVIASASKGLLSQRARTRAEQAS